jgi:MFS family permease
MVDANAASAPKSKIATVLRVTSGNFLEMFDFFLFGFYATYISHAFFPAGSDFASLMLTFMTFGAGFLMRPLGAIFLGAYVDRIGRRQGLIVTLMIMATGTILIAFVPGYATIGLLAPFLVLTGRLLQGFSAGVELGGVSVYLSEMATPGNKGFYVSWQSGSQQVAIMAAAVIGYLLNQALAPSDVAAWGWRIPFFIGCMIVPFLFYIRRSLEETEEFLHRKHRPTLKEVFASLALNWQIVLLGMLLVAMTTISFYTITVYTPTFGKTVLKLSDTASLAVTFLVRQHAGSPAVAVVSLRQLQRGDGRGLDGDRSGERPHGRVLACLLAGNRRVRRVHAAGLHLADQRDQRQGGSCALDDVRRHLRLGRHVVDLPSHGPGRRRLQRRASRLTRGARTSDYRLLHHRTTARYGWYL